MAAISFVNAGKKKKAGKKKSGATKNLRTRVRAGVKKAKRSYKRGSKGRMAFTKSITANLKTAAIEAAGALATDFLWAKATFIPVEYRTGNWLYVSKAAVALAAGAVLDTVAKGNSQLITSAVRGSLTTSLYLAGHKAINDSSPGTLPAINGWPENMNAGRSVVRLADRTRTGMDMSGSHQSRPLPVNRPLAGRPMAYVASSADQGGM